MRVVYLGKQYEEPLPLSYAEKPITDKGIQGARLMLKEANQAGNFVGHSFELEEAIVPADGDVVAKAKEVLAKGDRFIIADLEPADLLAVADLPEAKDAVIMNIRSSATSLRQEQCRVNVFHIIPDYAMRADALAQYLIWKKWPRWFVIRRDTPARPGLSRSGETLGRAASAARWSRTRSTICRPALGTWTRATSRSRRRSRWRPRPRPTTTWCGSSTATTISATICCTAPICRGRWWAPKACRRSPGTSPIPNPAPCISRTRIPRIAKRQPVERDYTAWLGFRALADSAMKSGKTTPPEVKAYMLSDQFKLEGFKGQAMSFRTWDHQMRQPIVLGGGTRVPVSTSPQEGFLHPTNVTDTLGFDQPETKCKFK